MATNCACCCLASLIDDSTWKASSELAEGSGAICDRTAATNWHVWRSGGVLTHITLPSSLTDKNTPGHATDSMQQAKGVLPVASSFSLHRRTSHNESFPTTRPSVHTGAWLPCSALFFFFENGGRNRENGRDMGDSRRGRDLLLTKEASTMISTAWPVLV